MQSTQLEEIHKSNTGGWTGKQQGENSCQASEQTTGLGKTGAESSWQFIPCPSMHIPRRCDPHVRERMPSIGSSLH